MTSKKGNSLLQGAAIGQNAADASLRLDLFPPLASRVIGRTNIGSGRKINQDAASAFFLANGKKQTFLLSLADGLGYSPHSDKAAFFAVTNLPREWAGSADIESSFEKVHRAILNREKEGKHQGSTTLVAAVICGNRAAIANVGDSRAYVIRRKEIVYQTRDQTVLELLLAQKRVENDPVALRRHPLRNVLMNAVGNPEPVYQFPEKGKIVFKKTGLPTVDTMTLKKGDVLLMASDGYYTNLSDAEMAALVSETPWDRLEETLNQKIRSVLTLNRTSLDEPANPDNYTFLVCRHP